MLKNKKENKNEKKEEGLPQEMVGYKASSFSHGLKFLLSKACQGWELDRRNLRGSG